MDIIYNIGYAIGGVLIFALFLASFNQYLPRWFCDIIGWHLEPLDARFIGINKTGHCPRCGKKVIQYSQGGWS